MKKLFLTMTVFAVGMLPVLFNSCTGAEHQGEVISASFKGFDGTCTLIDEEDLFIKTYHPFLVKHCASCHIPGGDGKGAFASGGPQVAWDSFRFIGYRKVSQYALDGGHNPPYTGQHLTRDVTGLQYGWEEGEKELSACGGKTSDIANFISDPYEGNRIHLRSKPISPELGETGVISWTVDSDVAFIEGTAQQPNLPGAVFELSYNAVQDPATGNTSYQFFNPILRDSTVEAVVESIRIKLNGTFIKNETTFTFAYAEVRPGQRVQLETGSIVAQGDIRTSDLISVAFGKINQPETPFPPPPVLPWASIQFKSGGDTIDEYDNGMVIRNSDWSISSYTRNTTTGGPQNENTSYASNCISAGTCKDIEIRLSEAKDALSVVYLQIDPGSTAKAECCFNFTPDNENDPVSLPNFDKDFFLQNISEQGDGINLSMVRKGSNFVLVFLPNETTQTIRVHLEFDERFEQWDMDNDGSYEKDWENIKFNIVDYEIQGAFDILRGNIDEEKNSVDLKIMDDDVKPDPRETKLTDLLKPGGVFRDQCITCHNPFTRDNDGRAVPYIMTSYQDLIDEQRIDYSETDPILRPDTSLLAIRMAPDIIAELDGGGNHTGTYYKKGGCPDDLPEGYTCSGLLGLGPMPITGELDPDEVGKVINWIQNGSKNN